MAKLIEQINNLEIKKYTPKDPYYYSNSDKRRYLVVGPNGVVYEDRLTLGEARQWCRRTKDFTGTRGRRH